ncbi:DUF4422 domain-containing protein [Commensalibacter communis]|uniref:DUF4422 domain-containing protein n=1 Tax=Commensalibacter communis TaxID=2972786 RepID=UPI0022FF5BF1|nr:DUF4422 domain-containing protein [Commensalibacter communis]CAI3937463.1 LPS:glycosyltransferase (RfaJ) (PDB:1G9R) [Commensalibacter communis]CAI3940772.1 LPS:glycosyltransferase (RfaJ) (PDB:1G9R) [Commensalibacter communis]
MHNNFPNLPQKQPSVKILLCHHKEAPYVKNECFVPIQVGKEISKVTLDYCIVDNTGDNISAKNKSWCELTALYWAWKNLDADYYGLMHYRRYLHFKKDDNNFYIINQISEAEIENGGWDSENIKSFCSQYDIVTAPIWGIHPVGANHHLMTGYDFYAKEHYSKDLDIIIDIVKAKYPQFYFSLLDTLSNKHCFFGNIAIMKKEYFYEYCDFLFGVLFEAEKRIDISSYNAYQYRIWGFIAERLINCYVIYATNQYPKLKLTTLGITFGVFDKPKYDSRAILAHKAPTTKKLVREPINICMSFDDNYAAHGDAVITSMIQNTHPQQSIHIYILHDEKLSNKNKKIIKQAENQNIRIYYVKINKKQFNALPLNREYISLNTYYRLTIQDLLPDDIKKIIYLDSDIIVYGNIAELWEEPLDNMCVGAVLDEGGILQARRLSLPDTNYFNAGIMIFNLAQIRKEFSNIFINYFENYYKYKEIITLQDQDILNITYSQKTKIIPLRWNINSRMLEYNDLEYKYSMKDAEDALQNIGIIHYTDQKKPWRYSCNHPFRSLYWKYRLKGHYKKFSLHELLVWSVSKASIKVSQKHVSFKLRELEININKEIIRKVLHLLKVKY